MLSLVSPMNELRLLLDENIKKELLRLLKSEGYDVIKAPKGYANGELGKISKSEQRILVTNDRHFTDSSVFPKEKIFSVVWLKIPQDKLESLLKAFSKLLKETKPEDFEGKLIILKEEEFEIVPIS